MAKIFSSGSTLPDDKTYLAPFAKLSPKRQAEIRKQTQDALDDAEANRTRPLGSRVLDAGYQMLGRPDQVKANAEAAAKDVSAREAKYQSARARAQQLGKDKTLYSDTTPHDLSDASDGMKKGGKVKKMASGGKVRGHGCETKGKTKGRFI